MEENDVQLGSEETRQRYRGAEADCYTHAGYPQRQVAGSAAIPAIPTIPAIPAN